MAYQSTEAAVINLNSSGSGVSDTNRGCILQVFNLISTGTTIAATMCLPCLLIYMVISVPAYEPLSISTLMHMTIQAYAMIMLLVIIVIEMEWSVAIRNISIMQSWGSRGLCYIFVGLLVFQEMGGMTALPCTARYPFLKAPCVALLGLGLIYSVMGALCLKKVRDTKMARYIQLLSHFEVENVIRKNATNSRSMVSIATSNDSEMLL